MTIRGTLNNLSTLQKTIEEVVTVSKENALYLKQVAEEIKSLQKINIKAESTEIVAEARFIKLETVVQNITEIAHGQAVNLKELAEDIQVLTKGVSDHVTSTAKTNWSTLASWSAVVLTFVSLAGFGFVRDIGKLEDSYKTVLWEEVIPYLREGHVPVLSAKVEEIDSRLARMDTRITYEVDKLMSWYKEQNDFLESLHENGQLKKQ
jgi:hypothetical protein